MPLDIKTRKTLLLNIIKAADAMADEATLDITSEGIALRGLAPDHTAMMAVNYQPADFETFVVDEPVKLGLKTQDIIKAVKRLGDSVSITLGDYLTLASSGKKFDLRTINTAAQQNVPLPNVPYTAKITMARKDLLDALADVAVTSEGVTIEADETVSLYGKGDMGASSTSPTVQKEISEPTKATYNLERLTQFVESVDTESVILEFGTKMPVKITLDKIVYYVAPRVSD